MNTKVDLKLIVDTKRKLIEAIYLAFDIPVRTQEENELLKEILEYSLMDQVGRYEERYHTLRNHLYIVNGILYKHNSSSKLVSSCNGRNALFANSDIDDAF